MTAQELWKAIKISNQLPDGSVFISAERVKWIEEQIEDRLSTKEFLALPVDLRIKILKRQDLKQHGVKI